MRARGMKAQMTIIVDIIETMLTAARVNSASSLNREKEGTHKGWRLTIPNFDASKPVRNGSTAEPAWPTLAMYPRQPVRSQRGRMVVEWFMRMGNMGPKKKPTKETAIASPTRDGTSQTISSSLRWYASNKITTRYQDIEVRRTQW